MWDFVIVFLSAVVGLAIIVHCVVPLIIYIVTYLLLQIEWSDQKKAKTSIQTFEIRIPSPPKKIALNQPHSTQQKERRGTDKETENPKNARKMMCEHTIVWLWINCMARRILQIIYLSLNDEKKIEYEVIYTRDYMIYLSWTSTGAPKSEISEEKKTVATHTHAHDRRAPSPCTAEYDKM